MSPQKQRYTLSTLPGHLAALADAQQLHRLLADFDFIEAKLEALGVRQLLEDYDLAKNPNVSLSEEQGKTLTLIQGAIRLSAHILERDKRQLVEQLLGRLLEPPQSALKKEGQRGNPDIQAMLAQAKQWKGAPWLRPLTPNLTPPGGALLRTLTGHTHWVQAVAIIPDGQKAVSASEDKTLKIWDLNSGEPVLTLTGHTDSVNAVAITPDGQKAVSASEDKTLKIWDLNSGEPVLTLTGHTQFVQAVAITPDGQQAISASSDNTLKIWDLNTGKEMATFTSDGWLNCCAVAPNGVTVVAGDHFGRVHFLRLEGGATGI